MTRPLEVLVDMDGILCDIVTPWLAWINERSGESLTIADITDRRIHKVSKMGGDIYGYFDNDHVFLDLDPLPGAIDGFRELNARCSVTIVTTVRNFGHHNKIKWVQKHLPFFDTDNMIFASKKHLVRGDVLFDDHPGHLKAFPGSLPIGIEYPWNIQAVQGTRATLVKNWESFISIMRIMDYDKNKLVTVTNV